MRRLAKISTLALALSVGSAARGSEMWKPAPPYVQPRGGFALSRLLDGRVLAAGGLVDGKWGAKDVAIFDPKTNTWSSATPMSQGRSGAAAVTLATGEVLVVGGMAGWEGGSELSSAELYDPVKNTWTTVAPIAHPTESVRLARLTDGRVAAFIPGTGVTMFETYDPATRTWARAESPTNATAWSCASLPDSGLLLIGPSGAERYRWYDGWKTVPGLPPGSGIHAVTLTDGRVLAAGGALAEVHPSLLDPADYAWRRVEGDRYGPASVVVLSDGRALLSSQPVVGAPYQFDVFEPRAMTTKRVASLAASIVAATGLADGRALIFSYGDTPGAGAGHILTVPNGCSADSECTSGHCVDGFCCDSACTGQCEACDVLNAVGTCSPVTGAPHGARAACSPAWTPSCRALTCDGARDRNNCVVPTIKVACDCARDDECDSGHCVDGVCCDTACDGQCEACDLPTSRGVCTGVTGEPRGVRKGCTADANNVCSTQICVPTERRHCVFVHGGETPCSDGCPAGILLHCDGAGQCGRAWERCEPDTGCGVTSTERAASPRWVDALLVIALGAVVERASRRRERSA